jgi:hypothetical protein
MNVEIGAEAAQFPEKEYINGIAFAVHSSLQYHFGTALGYREVLHSLTRRRAIQSAGQMSLPVTCQAACVVQMKPDRQSATCQT